TENSIRRSEWANLQLEHCCRDVWSNLPDFGVGHLDLRGLEERAVIGFVAGDDGGLSRPMHADDVDPLRVVIEEFSERRHVVLIPGGCNIQSARPGSLLRPRRSQKQRVSSSWRSSGR